MGSLRCFRVLLNAENFLVVVDGKEQLMGFYVTHFVEASDETDAEIRAVEATKSEPKLKEGTLNRLRGISEIPMIYLEEISEIRREEMQSNQGKCWYKMGT